MHQSAGGLGLDYEGRDNLDVHIRACEQAFGGAGG